MGGPTILAFDTATDATAVATSRGIDLVAESSDRPVPGSRPRHGEILLPMIAEVVERSGGWGAIDRIVVGTGPGTYTGLRIGLATAGGLSASSGAELIGISTLTALAASVTGSHRHVAAMVDARRGEVFAALYRTGGDLPELRSGPLVRGPARFAELMSGAAPGALAIGSGALHFREELIAEGFEVPDPGSEIHDVSAAVLARLGAGVDDPSSCRPEPIYLRPPDAQRWRQRDAGTDREPKRP